MKSYRSSITMNPSRVVVYYNVYRYTWCYEFKQQFFKKFKFYVETIGNLIRSVDHGTLVGQNCRQCVIAGTHSYFFRCLGFLFHFSSINNLATKNTSNINRKYPSIANHCWHRFRGSCFHRESLYCGKREGAHSISDHHSLSVERTEAARRRRRCHPSSSPCIRRLVDTDTENVRCNDKVSQGSFILHISQSRTNTDTDMDTDTDLE